MYPQIASRGEKRTNKGRRVPSHSRPAHASGYVWNKEPDPARTRGTLPPGSRGAEWGQILAANRALGAARRAGLARPRFRGAWRVRFVDVRPGRRMLWGTDLFLRRRLARR